ncbi:hypothetical protein HYR65_00150, partial [Candidatus Azambacteria bacterium]|nr:hypothetical protein [Candidatus Azambacteria bacterium]
DKIEKLPSAASLKEPLENAWEKTEERENSALIAIVSATSTQPDLIPERFVKKSREKVQKRERNLREAALSVEKAMLEGRDVKGADEKIKNAQSIIDRAREDLDRGEIRASLEQSMEAEKITKEIRRFERKREREKEREEKETESRRNEDALDEKH